MRIMGLDLGKKRVGVALSDESQTLATPFEVIQHVSFAKLLARLTEIITEQQVGALVIGDPRSLSSEAGPQAEHIAREAQRIQEHLHLPLVMWDERLSTVRAKQLLSERGVRRRGARKKPLDAIVAAMILQEYLDAHHTPSVNAELQSDDKHGATF